MSIPKTDKQLRMEFRKRLDAPDIWDVDENGEMQRTDRYADGHVTKDDYHRLLWYVEELEGVLRGLLDDIGELPL